MDSHFHGNDKKRNENGPGEARFHRSSIRGSGDGKKKLIISIK